MATLALQPLRFVYSQEGKTAECEKRVLTTGTPIAGEVFFLANDQLTIASNDPTTISYLGQDAGVNVIPGDVASTINVQKIRLGDVFEISIWHATPASAVIAATDVDGKADYGLESVTVSGVSAWVLDISDTSNKALRIIKALGTYGDLYQRVLVQFLATNLTFAP